MRSVIYSADDAELIIIFSICTGILQTADARSNLALPKPKLSSLKVYSLRTDRRREHQCFSAGLRSATLSCVLVSRECILSTVPTTEVKLKDVHWMPAYGQHGQIDVVLLCSHRQIACKERTEYMKSVRVRAWVGRFCPRQHLMV